MLVNSDERFRLTHFWKILLVYLVTAILVIVIASQSRLLYSGLPLICYFLLSGLILYGILTYVFADTRKIVRFFALGGAEITAAMLIVLALSATVIFGLLCQEIDAVLTQSFTAGPTTDWLNWIGFGFDNLLEAVLLDAPEIYGFTFSQIQPSNFWTQTLVFAFRTSVNLLILKTLLRYFRYLHSYSVAIRV